MEYAPRIQLFLKRVETKAFRVFNSPLIGCLQTLRRRPWEVLAVKFTLLDPGRDCKENVLVMTDALSKFALAFPTKNQKGDTVASNLVKMIVHCFGCTGRLHIGQDRKVLPCSKVSD